MDVCLACGQELRPQARFCPKCGSPVVHQADYPLITGKEAVNQYRGIAAQRLLELVSLESDEFREKNKALFEKCADRQPPLQDNAWLQVAFIAGLYGQKWGPRELPLNQRLGLWQALVWAVEFEHYVRPNFVVERFLRLVDFLQGSISDAALSAYALQNMRPLLDAYDPTTLKQMRADLAKMPKSSVIAAIEQTIEDALKAQYEPALAALERLWRFLDNRKEEQNRQRLASARAHGVTQQTVLGLVTMSVYIVRGALAGYTANLSRGNQVLSEADLRDAVLLADFAAHHATGNFLSDAQQSYFLLLLAQEVSSSQLDPPAIVQRLQSQWKNMRPNGSTPPWSQATPIIVSFLAARRKAGNKLPETAAQWADIFAALDGTGAETRAALLEEARQHIDIPLKEQAFPDAGQRGILLEYARAMRLDQIQAFLRRERASVFQALENALADPSFSQFQAPRQSLPIVSQRLELIPKIKELMASMEREKKEYALQLLERAERDVVDREQAAVVREWLLYVRACIYGPSRAIANWREDTSAGTATWEVKWNLAVALWNVNREQSLDYLAPGVRTQRASFAHLRFALYAALTLLQASETARETRESARSFALDNLVRLPLQECYLAWILLANDGQGSIDYDRQLDVVGALQDIMERPITLAQPAKWAGFVTIQEFESDFQRLVSLVRQLEEHYVIDVPQEKVAIRSKLLEIYVRTPQRPAQRVGLFVDYENLVLSLPRELRDQPGVMAKTLLDHASRYGEVVGSWICESPANIRNARAVESKFLEAGYKIEVPRGVTGSLSPKDNQSDYVLLECIATEMIRSKPDVYIIVSGDHLFYERIVRLLEQGASVRIIAYPKKLSTRYMRLRDRIEQAHWPEEYGQFAIDSLDAIFHMTPEQVQSLNQEIEASRVGIRPGSGI